MTLVHKSAVSVLQRTLKSAYRCDSVPLPSHLLSATAGGRAHVIGKKGGEGHLFLLSRIRVLSPFPPTPLTRTRRARFGVEAECFVTTPGTGAGIVDLKKEEERRQLLLSGRGGRRGLLVYATIGAVADLSLLFSPYRRNMPPLCVVSSFDVHI